MEAVLRQQLVQVVAGNAALESRKAGADIVRIAPGQFAQGLDDARLFSARLQVLDIRGLVGGADPEARAGGGHDLQALDVLDRLAGHHRMGAA
ncbi:hypothetical protein [Cupriavidus necator]